MTTCYAVVTIKKQAFDFEVHFCETKEEFIKFLVKTIDRYNEILETEYSNNSFEYNIYDLSVDRMIKYVLETSAYIGFNIDIMIK